MLSFIHIEHYICFWRGVVGGAAAGEVNTPAGHLQRCLAGLKVCWVLDFSVVVGVYVREQLESRN